MPEQLVRVTRTAVAAVFLVLAAGACDSSTEIPTVPEGDIPFNAVAINSSTLQPASGTTLEAGSSGNPFHAEVAYQITSEEFNQGGNPFFFFWVESWAGNGATWEGDLHEEQVFANQQSGTQTFQGTFSVPTISPFCSAYSELTVAVQLLAVTEPPGNDPDLNPDDEKTTAGSTVDRIFANVNGATGTSANCMQNIVWHNGVPWWWGESMILWARNIDPAANVQFLVGPEGEQATIITEGHFENGESGFVVWLPPASDGQISMLVNGVEVPVYGANRRTSIDYDGDEDIFWPNDAFDDPAFDFIADNWLGSSVFVWNPSLSIHAPEQEVDASANPLGSETWMKGDWYSVWLDDIDSGTTVDVCSWIFFDGTDDLDLLIFNDQGGLLASSTASVGTTSEFVRVNGVAGGTELRLWVAPFSLATASGIYRVISGNCAIFGGSPESMTEMPDPSALRRSGAVTRLQGTAADVRSYSLTGDDVKARTTGASKDDLELH